MIFSVLINKMFSDQPTTLADNVLSVNFGDDAGLAAPLVAPAVAAPPAPAPVVAVAAPVVAAAPAPSIDESDYLALFDKLGAANDSIAECLAAAAGAEHDQARVSILSAAMAKQAVVNDLIHELLVSLNNYFGHAI